eukprot:34349-Rhodomonas_salina.2
MTSRGRSSPTCRAAQRVRDGENSKLRKQTSAADHCLCRQDTASTEREKAEQAGWGLDSRRVWQAFSALPSAAARR